MLSSEAISARETKCNEIDAAIEKMLEQVIALKTQRNEIALISSLPAEIMTNIFLFVKAEMENSSTYTRNVLQWIAVSHVSTHWRNIALNSVGLWTKPPFCNHLWASEMMKRSKLATLSIRFNFADKPHALNQTLPIIKQALARNERIRELAFLSVPSSQEDLMNALPANLPHLEKLHISGCMPSYAPDGRRLLVPGSILSGAGKLCQLNLSGCRTDWIPHLLPSITSLKLCEVGTVSDLTILQFIDTLENLPALMILELTNSFPARGLQDCGSRHVNLQKLRELSITSPITQAGIFFRHITFPPTAHVFVQTNERQILPDFTRTATHMLAAIGQSYSNCPSDTIFRSMSLNTGSSTNGIGITLTIPNNQNKEGSSAFLSLSLNTVGGINTVVRASILHKMFDSGFYLEDISSVSLTLGSTPQGLAHSLGQLPNVSYIKVSDTIAADNLIDALQLPVTDSSQELCFPNLSILGLYEISFSDLPAHGPDNIPITKLQDCLIRRYECGVEITKVILEYCDRLNIDHVNLLTEIVVDVEWDEVETGFTDSDDDDNDGCDCPDCAGEDEDDDDDDDDDDVHFPFW